MTKLKTLSEKNWDGEVMLSEYLSAKYSAVDPRGLLLRTAGPDWTQRSVTTTKDAGTYMLDR